MWVLQLSVWGLLASKVNAKVQHGNKRFSPTLSKESFETCVDLVLPREIIAGNLIFVSHDLPPNMRSEILSLSQWSPERLLEALLSRGRKSQCPSLLFSNNNNNSNVTWEMISWTNLSKNYFLLWFLLLTSCQSPGFNSDLFAFCSFNKALATHPAGDGNEHFICTNT